MPGWLTRCGFSSFMPRLLTPTGTDARDTGEDQGEDKGESQHVSAKRGRGRPRKNPAHATSATSATEPAASPAGPKRPRGRPRKSDVSLEVDIGDAPSAPTSAPSPGRVPASDTALSTAALAKRQRGRPRKDSDADVATAATNEAPTPKPGKLGVDSDAVAKRPRGRPRKDGAPPQHSTAAAVPSLNLRQCRGRYAITCPSVTEQWGDANDLTLDVCDGHTPGTLQAAMGFGIVEGTMILSLSKDAALEDPTSEGELGGDADDQDEEDDGGSGSYNGLGKRKATPFRPSRPQEVRSSSPSRRMYLRWRGRDTGTGEIYYHVNPGFIDFNNNCTALNGTLFQVPAAGNVEFKGRKVDKAPRKQPEPWSAFSEEAYDEANQARWH
jgi:hypothetical protein